MTLFPETELFEANKKSQWVVFFRELGFEKTDLIWLEKELGNTTDTIPKHYLDKASTILTESFGELLPRLTWLLDAYTAFPYSKEKSAKVISRALEQASRHYPSGSVPLRYTTLANPPSAKFSELAANNYILQENQGKIDLVGAIGFLRSYEAIHLYFINILRANNNFIELELVFGYDADIANRLTKLLDDSSTIITYNKRDRVLTVNGQSIHFNSGLQAELCSTLFKIQSINKEWAKGEIFESWGLHDDEYKKQNRLVIYQTSKKVNGKVAEKTNGKITNLIKYTTNTATIDPEYRKFVSKC